LSISRLRGATGIDDKILVINPNSSERISEQIRQAVVLADPDTGVLELDTAEAYEKALAAGRTLVTIGADVIVLGCTGMTHMQDRLAAGLGVPVIDPCRAAVEIARNHLEEMNP